MQLDMLLYLIICSLPWFNTQTLHVGHICRPIDPRSTTSMYRQIWQSHVSCLGHILRGFCFCCFCLSDSSPHIWGLGDVAPMIRETPPPLRGFCLSRPISSPAIGTLLEDDQRWTSSKQQRSNLNRTSASDAPSLQWPHDWLASGWPPGTQRFPRPTGDSPLPWFVSGSASGPAMILTTWCC